MSDFDSAAEAVGAYDCDSVLQAEDFSLGSHILCKWSGIGLTRWNGSRESLAVQAWCLGWLMLIQI